MNARFVDRQRRAAWEFGRSHREGLVSGWMREHGETTRPLLREIIDELIEDQLHARLREEVLPLDRFAQTERVNGRLEVSVSSRIAEMPRVRDPRGVAYIAKWHETVHVVRHFPSEVSADQRLQPSFPGLTAEPPQLVACRRFSGARKDERSANSSLRTPVWPQRSVQTTSSDAPSTWSSSTLPRVAATSEGTAGGCCTAPRTSSA
jgi:hypothetical protein